MSVRTVLQYLFGQGAAIRHVAASQAALWAGVALVLLTAIARSYDQTFIAEKPIRWVFGPLAFSFVSGTWVYIMAYGIYARCRMTVAGVVSPPPFWSGWRSFMGLFWMTAPIAWLYAIPVERFLDPVAAAKANVSLLALVSLWRVLLIARVLQHLTRAPFYMALIWVLFPAAVEVLVVYFFSGQFALSLMASMGGLRNSPAEDVLLNALAWAFSGALVIAPATVLLSLMSVDKPLHPLPARQPDRFPGWALGATALVMVGAAVRPQIELARTVEVERHMAAGRFRPALEYLARHQPGDFAPARPLPPKPHEHEIFTYLPACFREIRADDPAWVRSFLVGRLDELLAHYSPNKRAHAASLGEDVPIDFLRPRVRSRGLSPGALLTIIDGLDRIPEGRHWLESHPRFIEALRKSADEVRSSSAIRLELQSQDWSEWEALGTRLREMFPTEPSP